MRLVDRGFEEGRGVSEPIVLSLNGVAPRFTVDVSIAPGAVMGSDVEIGPGSSVWFNATMRADVAPIRIGSGSNVRRARCLISMLAPLCIAGDRVTIGHGAVVPGTTAGDGVMIGLDAVAPSRSSRRERWWWKRLRCGRGATDASAHPRERHPQRRGARRLGRECGSRRAKRGALS